jgi:hypothetical protein
MGLRRPTPSLTISGAVGAGRGSSKAPSRDLLKRMRIGLETRSCDGAAYVTLDTDEVRRAATSLEAESQKASSTRPYRSHKAAILGSSALYGVGRTAAGRTQRTG